MHLFISIYVYVYAYAYVYVNVYVDVYAYVYVYVYVYVCHIAIRIQTPDMNPLRNVWLHQLYNIQEVTFRVDWIWCGLVFGKLRFSDTIFLHGLLDEPQPKSQADCGSIKNPNWEWTRTGHRYHICHCCLTTIIPIWINVEDSDRGSSLSTLAPGRMYSFTATMQCRAVASSPSALLQLRGLLKAVMAAA